MVALPLRRKEEGREVAQQAAGRIALCDWEGWVEICTSGGFDKDWRLVGEWVNVDCDGKENGS